MSDPMPDQAVDYDADSEPAYSEDGGSDNSIGTVLQRKYGPLPVWAYGVVIGGVILVFIVMRGGRKSSPQSYGGSVIDGSGGGSAGGDNTNTNQGSLDLSGIEDALDEQNDLLQQLLDNQDNNTNSGNPQFQGWLSQLRTLMAQRTALNNQIDTLKQQSTGGQLLGYRTYTVKSGDTVASIAKKFGVTGEQLKDVQDIPNFYPKVGRTLQIPKTQTGSTWDAVSKQYKTSGTTNTAQINALITQRKAINELIKKLEAKITGAQVSA